MQFILHYLTPNLQPFVLQKRLPANNSLVMNTANRISVFQKLIRAIKTFIFFPGKKETPALIPVRVTNRRSR